MVDPFLILAQNIKIEVNHSLTLSLSLVCFACECVPFLFFFVFSDKPTTKAMTKNNIA